MMADGPPMTKEHVDLFRLPARPPHSFLYSTNEDGTVNQDITRDSPSPLVFYPVIDCACASCAQYMKMNYRHSGFRESAVLDRLLHSGFNHLLSLSQTQTWSYTKHPTVNIGVFRTKICPAPQLATVAGLTCSPGRIIGRCFVNFNDTFLLNLVYLAMLASDHAVDNYLLHFHYDAHAVSSIHLARFKKTLGFLFKFAISNLSFSVSTIQHFSNEVEVHENALDYDSTAFDHQMGCAYYYNITYNYKCIKVPLMKKNPTSDQWLAADVERWFATNLKMAGFKFNHVNSPGLLL